MLDVQRSPHVTDMSQQDTRAEMKQAVHEQPRYGSGGTKQGNADHREHHEADMDGSGEHRSSLA